MQRALVRNIAWHTVREAPLNVEFLRYAPTPERAVRVCTSQAFHALREGGSFFIYLLRFGFASRA
jgi:hypothetical protein